MLVVVSRVQQSLVRQREKLFVNGPVKGGRVYGRWPGLAQEQLYEGRDLALTTDFRRVLGEVVYSHLGNRKLSGVFPGFENNPSQFLRFLG